MTAIHPVFLDTRSRGGLDTLISDADALEWIDSIPMPSFPQTPIPPPSVGPALHVAIQNSTIQQEDEDSSLQILATVVVARSASPFRTVIYLGEDDSSDDIVMYDYKR